MSYYTEGDFLLAAQPIGYVDDHMLKTMVVTTVSVFLIGMLILIGFFANYHPELLFN